MRWLCAMLVCVPVAVFAQTTDQDSDGGITFQQAPEGVIYSESEPENVEEIIREEKPISQSEPRPVALLRGLDKISGRVTDVRVDVGASVQYERLTITVDDCRAPPTEEDAFVFMRVQDEKTGDEVIFSGWMFASSPALSAMDHARYDLWVLSCATS